MKALIVIMLMGAVAASSASATAQIPDKIVYEGETYSLHSNPMEAFFAKNPDRKPEGGSISSALWRGYRAIFGFQADRLVVKDVEIEVLVEDEDSLPPYSLTTFEWKSAVDDVVPKGETLFVDWFTGILILPQGELVEYVHGGYESVYSDYILLEVKEGKLVGSHAFGHEQFREFRSFKRRRIRAYQGTADYSRQLEKLRSMDGTGQKHRTVVDRYTLSLISEFLDEGEK